ncbi:K(+)-transporting ATPase subunit C [Angustibacter speluncae]
MTHLTALARQTVAGLVVLLAFTALLGIAYPLAVTGVAALGGDQADRQLLRVDGEVVGSRQIGQLFVGEGWFRSRPSAAGDGYDGLASAASNLGPNNPDLLASVEERRAAVAEAEGVDPDEVPADALTASASGLDPDISPEYARLQVERVARERDLPVEQVRDLVAERTLGRTLGFLGEPRVNVLELNLALQRLAEGAGG